MKKPGRADLIPPRIFDKGAGGVKTHFRVSYTWDAQQRPQTIALRIWPDYWVDEHYKQRSRELASELKMWLAEVKHGEET